MIFHLDIPLSERLSDETRAAVAPLLNELANQWESRYFHRIRAHQARQQLDFSTPRNPGGGKSPIDLDVPCGERSH